MIEYKREFASTEVDVSELMSGPVSRLIDKLNEIVANHPDATDIDIHSYPGSSWDGGYTFVLVTRPETDEEYEKRVAMLKQRDAHLAEQAALKNTDEYKLYLSLMKKYAIRPRGSTLTDL